jgi:cytoskeletal protein RodZ
MPSERASGDFGKKLRDARERRGVSLRQIASATKISVSALEALERNDISRLPGGIFSRAFVRSYALEVGLDPETTIQEFIAQFPSDSVTAGHPTTDRVEDEEAVESDRQMANTVLRLILISIPIAIAVVYFGTSGLRWARRAPADPVPPPPVTATVTPQPPAPEPAAAPAETPATTPAATPAPTAETPAAADDRLHVSLSVTRPCWISADVDGQKKIQRLLQPGDPQTLTVTRELVLTAGDASAVEMTVNGTPAKPLGKSGEVVTRRLNPANFKDFLQPR